MLMIVACTFVLCAAVILGSYWMFVVRPETKAARARCGDGSRRSRPLGRSRPS